MQMKKKMTVYSWVDLFTLSQVLIVQAAAHTQYLGEIRLSFDENGNLFDWSGEARYLGNEIIQGKLSSTMKIYNAGYCYWWNINDYSTNPLLPVYPAHLYLHRKQLILLWLHAADYFLCDPVCSLKASMSSSSCQKQKNRER